MSIWEVREYIETQIPFWAIMLVWGAGIVIFYSITHKGE